MIPLNLYTAIAGEGGCGKTTLLVDRLSKATVGELEGHFLGTPINVLYCTTENDPHTAMAPEAVRSRRRHRPVHGPRQRGPLPPAG